MIDRTFFEENDVVVIARNLIGCCIQFTQIGSTLSGLISETEAYRAPEDKASHAYNYRRTARTETMYRRGGTAYIYLCYGIHHMFNIVTGPTDTPHAVLIRGLHPIDGIEVMKKRRKLAMISNLTNGPGKWTSAFGITTSLNGIDLLQLQSPIQLIKSTTDVPDVDIQVTPRIGIGYAKEWIDKPWRFVWKPPAYKY